ncbi:hypothetical protein CFR80_15135 [Komagataeibacter oboediens]|uniref:Uncharacterized protein n=1 Tax=Komagataeibacter oboediens TaxID=65958 RepID=A0A318QPE0_9PROT|nr:hypothetical protein CFR80_15135 [Komagataeibacter oboediens]
MWAYRIVVFPPVSQNLADMGQGREQRFVETFIPEAAIDLGVGHKVQTPVLPRFLKGRSWENASSMLVFGFPDNGLLAPSPDKGGTAFCDWGEAFPRQKIAQAAIPKTTPLARQILYTLPQDGIVRPGGSIPRDTSGKTSKGACPALTQRQSVLDMSGRLQPCCRRHHFFPTISFSAALSSFVEGCVTDPVFSAKIRDLQPSFLFLQDPL